MALISSKDDLTNTINCYQVSDVTNEESAVRWVNNVRYLPGILVLYISLADLLHYSDEGSESICFLNDISFEDLKNAVHERHIDAMSIAGTYFDKPIVVGVDLKRYYLFITSVNKNAADVKALEAALRLV